MLLLLMWSVITSTRRTFNLYSYVDSVLCLFVTRGPKISSRSKSIVFAEWQATPWNKYV